MKFRLVSNAILGMGVFLACSALPALSQTVSLEQYRQRLAELRSGFDELPDHPERAAALQSGLPESEIIDTGGREITVSWHELKGDLALIVVADPVRRKTLVAQIQNYVRTLNAEAAAYDKAGVSDGRARSRLQEILEQREFKAVQRKAGFLDRLKARIYGWLSRALGRLFRISLGSRFGVVQILIYGAAGAAILTVLIWTIRRLRRREEEPRQREIIPFSPSARGWRAWLGDARARARGQDWREAIHLAYWAGIAFLEEQGAWKPNRARTPREYLRLVGVWTPQHPPLAELTRKFERVWYGNLPAGEADFQETMGELERLGCR